MRFEFVYLHTFHSQEVNAWITWMRKSPIGWAPIAKIACDLPKVDPKIFNRCPFFNTGLETWKRMLIEAMKIVPSCLWVRRAFGWQFPRSQLHQEQDGWLPWDGLVLQWMCLLLLLLYYAKRNGKSFTAQSSFSSILVSTKHRHAFRPRIKSVGYHLPNLKTFVMKSELGSKIWELYPLLCFMHLPKTKYIYFEIFDWKVCILDCWPFVAIERRAVGVSPDWTSSTAGLSWRRYFGWQFIFPKRLAPDWGRLLFKDKKLVKFGK